MTNLVSNKYPELTGWKTLIHGQAHFCQVFFCSFFFISFFSPLLFHLFSLLSFFFFFSYLPPQAWSVALHQLPLWHYYSLPIAFSNSEILLSCDFSNGFPISTRKPRDDDELENRCRGIRSLGSWLQRWLMDRLVTDSSSTAEAQNSVQLPHLTPPISESSKGVIRI